MIFPSITEYREALRYDGALKKYSQLKLMTDTKGEPLFSSGNFAVVFRMRDELTGQEYAVKCFTREQERRQKSYALISENLSSVISPYLVHYEYLADEVWVNSRIAGDGEYPAVIMEWIESKTLGEKLTELCSSKDKSGIFSLACAFDRMALWLMEQPFAHGDLKTDNILIEPDGTLRLIDYDGMFTPEMEGEPARENGSPGFRHPMRSIDNFGPHIDDFSILLISLSLHALAENPRLISQHNFGDAILLDEAALINPGKGTHWEIIETLRYHNEVSHRLVMLYMAVGNPAEMRLFGMKPILKDAAAKSPIPEFRNLLPDLIPFRNGNLWGYCDENKKIVIDCIYWDTNLFVNGLAKVYKNWKWGFIDKTGKEIIPLKYDQTRINKGDYISVILRDKYGLVDIKGKVIVPCKYDNVCDFFEGLAAVECNNKWGFIDQSGNEVIKCKFDNVGRFKNGYARICFLDNDILTTKRKNKSGIGFSNEHETWGFINKKGEEDFTGKLGPIKVSIGESIHFNNSRFDSLEMPEKVFQILDGISSKRIKSENDIINDSRGTEFQELDKSKKVESQWKNWENIDLTGLKYREFYDLEEFEGILEKGSPEYGGITNQEIINIDGVKVYSWILKIVDPNDVKNKSLRASIISGLYESRFILKIGIAKFNFGNLSKGKGILLAFGVE